LKRSFSKKEKSEKSVFGLKISARFAKKEKNQRKEEIQQMK